MRFIQLIITMICVNALPLVAVNSVFIIVHGTWGAESNWYAPGGDFFDELERIVEVKNSAVVPFHWSGGIGHQSRVKAAQNLVKLIKTYNATTGIYLIAHSHGGNVCTLASQILSVEPGSRYRIRGLYTLGTPVMNKYLPNMDVVHYLYNLFSFDDRIQPVLGLSEREFFVHERIANLRVFIEDKAPDHSGLHHAVIGQVIPMLHRNFKRYLREKNINNTIEEPSIMYCYHNAAPQFTVDAERKRLLKRDRLRSVLMRNSNVAPFSQNFMGTPI